MNQLTAREALIEGMEITVSDDPTPRDESLRTFVTATHPNGRFLAIPGKPVKAAVNPSQSVSIEPVLRREGDVWVEFHGGICVTNDPIRIEWLEAHSGDPIFHAQYHTQLGQNPRECSVPVGLCREKGPGVDMWVQFKRGQLDLKNREKVIDPEIDIDAFMAGHFVAAGTEKFNGVGRKVEQAAENTARALAQRSLGRV